MADRRRHEYLSGTTNLWRDVLKRRSHFHSLEIVIFFDFLQYARRGHKTFFAQSSSSVGDLVLRSQCWRNVAVPFFFLSARLCLFYCFQELLSFLSGIIIVSITWGKFWHLLRTLYSLLSVFFRWFFLASTHNFHRMLQFLCFSVRVELGKFAAHKS